jgi:predicted transposase YbfD/YdcC
MIHRVSAWASQNRLVLGQRKVSEKSNEVTAIPELLKVLDLNGAVVSIDAMGCQTQIAAQIIAQQGDYKIMYSAKGNPLRPTAKSS